MHIIKNIINDLEKHLQFAKGFTYTNAIHFNQVLRTLNEVLRKWNVSYLTNFDWEYNRARCKHPNMMKGEIIIFGPDNLAEIERIFFDITDTNVWVGFCSVDAVSNIHKDLFDTVNDTYDSIKIIIDELYSTVSEKCIVKREISKFLNEKILSNTITSYSIVPCKNTDLAIHVTIQGIMFSHYLTFEDDRPCPKKISTDAYDKAMKGI